MTRTIYRQRKTSSVPQIEEIALAMTLINGQATAIHACKSMSLKLNNLLKVLSKLKTAHLLELPKIYTFTSEQALISSL